jgi:hypothetical protein
LHRVLLAIVITGLVPVIHSSAHEAMDCRDKPGNDDGREFVPLSRWQYLPEACMTPHPFDDL